MTLKERFERLREVLAGIQVVAMAILAIGFTAFAAWMAWGGDWRAAGASLAMALALFLASNLDKLESFKWWGVEAKMKDLDTKIHEADDVMEGLRDLAVLSGTVLVDLSAKAGRIDVALTVPELAERARSVRESLTKMHADPEIIRKAMAPWVSFATLDMVRYAIGPFRDFLLEKSKEIAHARDLVMDKRDPSLGDRCAELNNQLSMLENHRKLYNVNLVTTPVSERERWLLAYIENAPALTEDDRAAFRADVKRWAEEIAYLSANLELKSPDFVMKHLGQRK